MADIKITVDSSELKRATQHTEELRGANSRFEAKLKPLIDKERQFNKAVRQVNDAMRLGVATQKQAIAEVERLGKAYGRTKEQVDRTTASMTGIRKNTNRMNATIQNAGYQFGDFFVQVQSGQNALVAFSQQGAQLAGLLPGLAGAVTGVGLVLGSMLARTLMEGIDLFKSFGESIEEAATSIEKFEASASTLANAIEKKLPKAAITAFEIFEEERLEDAIKKVEAQLTKSLDKTEKGVEELNKDLQTTIEMFEYELGSGRLDGDEILSGLQEIKILEDTIKGIEEVEELFREIASVDLDNPEQLSSIMETIALRAKFLKDQNKINAEVFNELNSLVEILGGRLLSSAEAQQATVESTEKIEETIKDTVVHSRELVQLFGQLQALSAGIDEAFKRTAIQASLIGDGVSKALAGQMASMRMKISEERAKLTELVGPRFADELLKGRSGQLAQHEVMLAQINAPTPSTGGGGGGVKPEDQGEKLAEAYAKFQDKLDGVLLSRRQEILLNREIVDLSKEEQDLVKALGVTRSQLTDIQKQSYDEILELRREDIALLKQQQAEEEKLAKAKEKVQAVSEVLASETVGALKSIVNGTKTASEAFRDMALNIIQQIMDILIWQPLIDSLTRSISGSISGAQSGGGALGGIVSSIFGFQKGGAFSSGNIIPFANGGVVGSPTMFGMSGGRPGLMGEAGPEAIMPLKRGSDGKLGVEGGGNVTVHQTFNFSANGDESVKKIIAQAAPKIAQMTEAKIINSRQRGGQMRRAFG